MSEFKLEPADTLVKINQNKDPFSYTKRWALSSPYDHVFIYMGKLFIEKEGEVLSKGVSIPMLFESNGRGVVLQTLSNRYGEEVVVMRAKENWVKAKLPMVIDEAVKLASESQAYYDYLCIARYVLPRLIYEKLGLPIPLKYHRDQFHICSEAVFEVFYRAKLVDILPGDVVPLPGDFVTDSPLLKKVGKIALSEEVV